MTLVQAQQFVRYALDNMTEDEHTAALLALIHCFPTGVCYLEYAEAQLLGELTRQQRERLMRVARRCAEVKHTNADQTEHAEADQFERYARAKCGDAAVDAAKRRAVHELLWRHEAELGVVQANVTALSESRDDLSWVAREQTAQHDLQTSTTEE